jgi:hypothetical protein
METEGSLSCSEELVLVHILSQMHPVYIFPPYFLKVHSKIIFSSTHK